MQLLFKARAFGKVLFFQKEGCGDKNHQVADCPSKVRVKSEIVKKIKFSENKEETSAKIARLNKMYSFVSINNSFQSFIIDSGASNHMCGDENMFKSLERGSFGEIVVASGKEIYAKGKGEIVLKIGKENEEIEITLIDVLFVPEITANLISVKKITEKGISVIFNGNTCVLRNSEKGYLIGKFDNGTYKLSSNKYACASYQVSDALCVHEWHKKLAHRHLGDVRKFLKKI